MCNNCGCNADPFAFNAEKKNCGCGQDPCVTYGAESFGAESLEDLDKSQLIDLIKNLEDRDEYVKGYVENAAESLMAINQNTPISNFTTNELTHSSTVQGDFNQASINSSGHQNFEVRGAEEPIDAQENLRQTILSFIIDSWDEEDEEAWRRHLNTYDTDMKKAQVLDKIMARHDRMKLQSDSIAYELDRMEWMLENPDKDYDDYAESFGAESYSESDLHDLIQSIWDGLGEAGRNEHYELFREYFGEGEEMAAESFGAESKKCSFCKTTDVKNFSQGWDDYCMACARRHLKDYYAESFGAEWVYEDDGWHEDMTDAELKQMFDEQMDAMKQYQLVPCRTCGSKEIGPEHPSEGSLISCDHCGAEYNLSGELTMDVRLDDGAPNTFSPDFLNWLGYWKSIEQKGFEGNNANIENREYVMSKFPKYLNEMHKSLYAESFGAEYGKRQRFGNRYVGRDTKGKFISNVSVGRSLKADRRTKSKTPARSGFGHKGDTQKGASAGFKLPTDAKSVIGMGAVLGGLLAYLESKA